MAVYIKRIAPNSLASNNGILPGWVLLKINGKNINNFLDLQFYAADPELIFLLQDEHGNEHIIEVENDFSTNLGIEIQFHSCRTCCNKCIFCFVDQMPQNLRQSLYVKDDDYVFSFVYGNFITLTNLSETDFDKIIEQRISPLYISVHTTNPVLHQKMLRYQFQFNILEKLQQLTAAGIQLHTQIVVVPEWNDGMELQQTLQQLTKLKVLSVGIVPVGLTRFRQNLPKIRNITSKEAKKILQLSKKFPNVFCSDEIYLLADQPLPSYQFYKDFPQLENGIGMLSLLLRNWRNSKQKFLQFIDDLPYKVVFITGKLVAEYIKNIVEEINEKIPQKARIKVVKNNFFGETVTVSGLLTATDILQQVKLAKDEIVAFSSNLFNSEFYTLDGMKQAELKKKLGNKLLIIDEEFVDWKLV
jgi:putative radical SAM enzyme (TIGR03279 family)